MRTAWRTLRVILIGTIGTVWLVVYMAEGALDQMLALVADPPGDEG